MAIPSTPPINLRADIRAEFSSNSIPSQDSLVGYGNKVFGTSPPHSILDFAGLSAPFGHTMDSVTNIDSDSAFFNGTLSDSGGTDCTVYFIYSTTSDFSSNVNTTSEQSKQAGTNIGVGAGVSGLSPDTTYYVKLASYNGFNDNDPVSGGTISFTTDPSCIAPANIFVTSDFSGFDISWDSVSGADDYHLMYRVNSGSWITLGSAISGTSYNHEGCNSAFNDGDTVDYRVRSNCGGSSSAWIEDLGNSASCF